MLHLARKAGVAVATITLALSTFSLPANVASAAIDDGDTVTIDEGSRSFDIETGEELETVPQPEGRVDVGYVLRGLRYHNGEYTIKLVGAADAYRANVAAAISNIHEHGLASLTLAPGTVASAPARPARGEIYLSRSTTSGCGGSWVGCADNWSLSEDGVAKSFGGYITIHPNIQSSSVTATVLHELGHIFGLEHYDGTFGGTRQVMNTFVESSSAWWLKTGDIAGMRHLNHPRPTGGVELVSGGVESIRAAGWLRDPLHDAPASLHLYVDGVGRANTVAELPRTDVGAHGFDTTVSAGAGSHEVCAYAVSRLITHLGCRTVAVRSSDSPPIGTVEAVSTSPGKIRVAGWALDPDTREPIDVHVYVGATGTAHRADRSRPDVDRIHQLGAAHGFDVTVDAPVGGNSVCVYAINDRAGGGNTLFDCRTVTVTNAAAIGNLEEVTPLPSAIRVSGWALDPDTSASTNVHVYIDGVGTAYTANLPRADVQRAYGLGDKHGFSITAPVSPGSHTVCVYAINWPNGTNTLLGCRDLKTSS